jgi:DNA-binding NarL/FixJ family response regulator
MKTLLLYMTDQLEEQLLAQAIEARAGFRVIPCDRQTALRAASDADVGVLEEDHRDDMLSFIHALLRVNPKLSLLVLGLKKDPVPYLEAGAMAWLERDASVDDLMSHAEALGRGATMLEPGVVGQLVRRLQDLSRLCVDQGVDLGRCAALSPREREVMELIARGYHNERVADELGIALGTIKTHVHNILRKLDVENRREASAYWRLYRRIDPPRGRPRRAA